MGSEQPASAEPAAELNRQRAALGAALVVVLGVAGFVVLRDHGAGDPVAKIQPVVAPVNVAPGKLPSGWNLNDGGNLTNDKVIAPQAAPDGAATAKGGQQAEAAGPGDYVGFQPASLTLPSGKQAPVSVAGVRDDGTLAVPDDPAHVGWWTGGALPGERYGGVVLAGHVDSRSYGEGVLSEMLKIKNGAVITVGGAAPGQQQNYKVTRVEQIVKARLAAGTGAFEQNVSQRLVLITCGGPYNRQTHHYRDNVVVIAEPIS